MKKLLLVTAIAFVTLNSCKKDAGFSEVNKPDNMLIEQNKIMNSKTPALIIDQHLDFPGPFDLVNQCSGETVTVTGTLSDDMHIVINGNTMNLSDHFQGQLKGIGSLDNTYISNSNENVALNGIPNGSGLFIIEDVTIFRMISTSGAPDFNIRRNAHLTVNANVVVTVDKVDFDVICHG